MAPAPKCLVNVLGELPLSLGDRLPQLRQHAVLKIIESRAVRGVLRFLLELQELLLAALGQRAFGLRLPNLRQKLRTPRSSTGDLR